MRAIVQRSLVAAAVIAVFAVTYLAFAPHPRGGQSIATTLATADATPRQGEPAAPATADTDAASATALANAAATAAATAGDQSVEPAAAVAPLAAPDDTPVEGVDHWKQGRQFFWQHDYAAAAIDLERANRQRPGRYYPHYLLGLTYQRLGEPQRAEQEYIAAREIDGDQPEALVNLARLYLETDRTAEALELCVQATEATPDYDPAWNVLGRAHLELGERAAAIQAFREACRLRADNAYAWNNLGYALIQAGDFDTALAPLERAVALDRDVAYMHNNLGVVLEQLGRLEEAQHAFARAVEIDPGHRPAAASAERLAELLAARPVAPATETAGAPATEKAGTGDDLTERRESVATPVAVVDSKPLD